VHWMILVVWKANELRKLYLLFHNDCLWLFICWLVWGIDSSLSYLAISAYFCPWASCNGSISYEISSSNAEWWFYEPFFSWTVQVLWEGWNCDNDPRQRQTTDPGTEWGRKICPIDVIWLQRLWARGFCIQWCMDSWICKFLFLKLSYWTLIIQKYG